MMLRLSTFCLSLVLVACQNNGYDYNAPNRPFGQRPSSNRPGSLGSSSGTTTPYPIRPQNDDFGGPTTGYPSGSQNSPSSSQRPGYPSSSYPESSGGSGSYNNGGGGYPGQSDSNYPQGNRDSSPGGYPGQSNTPYLEGNRGSSNRFPGQGSRYPDQGQNYPGQSGSNFGNVGFSDDDGSYQGGDFSAIPGEPDIDYPILSYVPQTNFNCKSQLYPGYYADVEARCQVFHICANNRTYDFLCPNGTVFSQVDFVCVWWNQFDCRSAPGLYELNAQLYDYSKRGSSDITTFNDYSGGNYPAGNIPQRGPQDSRPGNDYPGNLRSQGPTTPYPNGNGGPSSYPGQGSPTSYPGSQGPSNNYPASQGSSEGYPGGNYPDYQGPNSYSNAPQGQSGPGSPSSSTPYPGTSPNRGYPSGRPNGTSFPSRNGGRQPQKPSREYLPPRNKRTKQSSY